jgi:DNA-binding response OmpR family regulator
MEDPTPNEQSPTGTVLVADDDLAIRVVVSRRFRSLGFDVIEAGDGNEALELTQGKTLALVVSDWDMPGLDGVQMARTLADAVTGQGPPAILLTARDFEIKDDTLDGTNVVAVMRKPFSGRKLVERAVAELNNPAATSQEAL